MVIVTGGTGYIGSHTTVELINNGYEVVILDNLSNSHESVLDSIEEITGTRPGFYKVDIANEGELKSIFKKIGNKAQSVIHFAAMKAVGESTDIPLTYYRNNLNSLINILDEMQDYEIRNLVFSSSCTVYGQPDKFPVTEETVRKEAESPYGNTKSVGEDIMRDASQVSDLNTIALRYFNPIGAHPSAKIGELPVGKPNNLVPFVTQTAAGIRDYLTIFGDDYPTVDGTCVRDYIHVVDLAKAHLCALKRLESQKSQSKFEVFNIGTGKGSSVLQVVNGFKEATGIDIEYQIGPRREGDITEIYADTTLANDSLDWKAELTLAEGLKSSWEWEKNYRSKQK